MAGRSRHEGEQRHGRGLRVPARKVGGALANRHSAATNRADRSQDHSGKRRAGDETAHIVVAAEPCDSAANSAPANSAARAGVARANPVASPHRPKPSPLWPGLGDKRAKSAKSAEAGSAGRGYAGLRTAGPAIPLMRSLLPSRSAAPMSRNANLSLARNVVCAGIHAYPASLMKNQG